MLHGFQFLLNAVDDLGGLFELLYCHLFILLVHGQVDAASGMGYTAW